MRLGPVGAAGIGLLALTIAWSSSGAWGHGFAAGVLAFLVLAGIAWGVYWRGN